MPNQCKSLCVSLITYSLQFNLTWKNPFRFVEFANKSVSGKNRMSKVLFAKAAYPTVCFFLVGKTSLITAFKKHHLLPILVTMKTAWSASV